MAIILRPKQLSCLILAVVYFPTNYDAFTMKKLLSFIVISCDKLLCDYSDASVLLTADSLETNHFDKTLICHR